MAATQKLVRFTVNPAGTAFDLTIEGEDGRVLDLRATREQVDVIADGLDEVLSQDESADEVETDEVDDDEMDGDEVEDDEVDDDELDDDEVEDGGVDGHRA